MGILGLWIKRILQRRHKKYPRQKVHVFYLRCCAFGLLIPMYIPVLVSGTYTFNDIATSFSSYKLYYWRLLHCIYVVITWYSEYYTVLSFALHCMD